MNIFLNTQDLGHSTRRTTSEALLYTNSMSECGIVDGSTLICISEVIKSDLIVCKQKRCGYKKNSALNTICAACSKPLFETKTEIKGKESLA